MYKTLEISEVIGTVYAEDIHTEPITISQVKSIMKKVNEYDQFITTILSRSTIEHAVTLSGETESQIEKGFYIVQDKPEIRSNFMREYWGMDDDTREVISKVIKEFFKK